MTIKKEALYSWLQHEVTELQEKAITSRIAEIKDQIVLSHNEREQDMFMKGMVHALSEVLDHQTWTQDLLIEEEDGDLQAGKSSQ